VLSPGELLMRRAQPELDPAGDEPCGEDKPPESASGWPADAARASWVPELADDPPVDGLRRPNDCGGAADVCAGRRRVQGRRLRKSKARGMSARQAIRSCKGCQAERRQVG
jgi:hypothetical protein